MGSLPGDKAYKPPDEDEDYDDDEDPAARPTWANGEVHVVKIPMAPHWIMGKYMTFYVQTMVQHKVTPLVV